MENSLLGAGVFCIIAAIIGGGLKAFGMEMPLLKSTQRQLLLGFVGIVLAGIALKSAPGESRTNINDAASPNPAAPSKPAPHLSYGTWTLRNAVDDHGTDWSDSTLKFDSQEAAPDGLVLKGEFTWRLNGVLIGTEEFTGRYVDSNRQVIFEGQSVKSVSEANRLAVGSYSAVVSEDERTLLNGRWGSTMTHEAGVAGKWEATR